jgi:membrane protease YdiL (CAAX protease family)
MDAAAFFALAPLAAASLALGAPRLFAAVPPGRATAARATILLTFCYLLACTVGPRFDPYATAIFAATTAAALAALAGARDPERGLGAQDLAIWLLLWIPFDLRWTGSLLEGSNDFVYAWWSLDLVVVGVLGFGRLRALSGFDYRLAPRGRDFAAAAGALAAFGAIAIPVGLATGFLRYPPARPPALGHAAGLAPAIFLTIALPEEVYFRGVLQAGLERPLGRRAALFVASLAFGLMHWNNAATLARRIEYCALASVAGLFYGLAYSAGGSILAPAICHTVVDLVWNLVFE